MGKDIVIVLIVTYNRKKLLTKSVFATLKQSYKINKIIVFDNHSIDGTERLFENNGIFSPKKIKNIDYVRNSKNVGGAGGFYLGMKYALKNYKFNWLWIYDDDTIPENGALNYLIQDTKKIKTKISFMTSSIISPKHKIMNVPSIDERTIDGNYPNWSSYLDKGMIKIKRATFVSLLINKEAISKMGLPIKEYFIWGDDTEYTLRLTTFFAPAYLSGTSKAFHLRKETGSLTIKNENNKSRIKMFHFLYRNSLLNDYLYRSKKGLIKSFINSILFGFSCFFSPGHHRFLKFLIVEKGIFEFLFFNKKILRNRFQIPIKKQI